MSTVTRRDFVAHLGEGALAASATLPLAEWLRRQPTPPELEITDVKGLRRGRIKRVCLPVKRQSPGPC
jgi:hypothetical protein